MNSGSVAERKALLTPLWRRRCWPRLPRWASRNAAVATTARSPRCTPPTPSSTCAWRPGWAPCLRATRCKGPAASSACPKTACARCVQPRIARSPCRLAALTVACTAASRLQHHAGCCTGSTVEAFHLLSCWAGPTLPGRSTSWSSSPMRPAPRSGAPCWAGLWASPAPDASAGCSAGGLGRQQAQRALRAGASTSGIGQCRPGQRGLALSQL